MVRQADLETVEKYVKVNLKQVPTEEYQSTSYLNPVEQPVAAANES